MILSASELMPVIRASLERGQSVPHDRKNGASMLPFIRDGAEVELEPVRSQPVKGDVVLVRCVDESYVLHRVIRIDGDVFRPRRCATALRRSFYATGCFG